MIHQISAAPENQSLAAMAKAIEACTACGHCLPACPTFSVTSREAESPRGRIMLMRHQLEGTLSSSQIQPYLDSCLQCGICETVCPAQVPYQSLRQLHREHSGARRSVSFRPDPLHSILKLALPHPGWFRFFARAVRLLQPARDFLPESFRSILDLLPPKLPPHLDRPNAYAGRGRCQGQIGLLPGCTSSVLQPDVTQAAIEVLTRNGFDVVLPDQSVCCGAILSSLQDSERARQASARVMESFPDGLDTLVSTSGYCSRELRHYPMRFADSPQAEESARFAARTMDISSFLLSLDLPAPPALSTPVRVAYHDSCHFHHGMGAENASLKLLQRIERLDLVELEAPATCCGAPGTYAIDQPEMAKTLGRRRVHAVHRSGASILATDDPGCMTQLSHHSALLGHSFTVRHTIEILARAYNRQPLD